MIILRDRHDRQIRQVEFCGCNSEGLEEEERGGFDDLPLDAKRIEDIAVAQLRKQLARTRK
jgi:hypothetical protein